MLLVHQPATRGSLELSKSFKTVELSLCNMADSKQQNPWEMLSVDLNAFRTKLGEAVMCNIKDIDGCCSSAEKNCSQAEANTQVQYKSRNFLTKSACGICGDGLSQHAALETD